MHVHYLLNISKTCATSDQVLHALDDLRRHAHSSSYVAHSICFIISCNTGSQYAFFDLPSVNVLNLHTPLHTCIITLISCWSINCQEFLFLQLPQTLKKY